MPDGKVCPEQFRGWLLKWTNYFKGYQKRWFVLSNGLLSYYRTQEEMAHTCRGTINLASAFIDTIDSTSFVITNGPSQVFHLRTINEVERQRWVTALELAKAKAIKGQESEDSLSESEDEEGAVSSSKKDKPLAALQKKLRELNTAYELVEKNNHMLVQQIAETEVERKEVSSKLKERLALFKLTADAMVKAGKEFVKQARSTERQWSKALQHERSLRTQLEENLEVIAKQMQSLEKEAIVWQESIPPRLDSIGTESGDSSVVTYPPHDGHMTYTPGSDDSHMTFPQEPQAKSPAVTAAANAGTEDGGVHKSKRTITTIDEESDDEDKFFDAPGTSSLDVVPSFAPESSSEDDHRPPLTQDMKMLLPDGPAPSFFEKWQPTLDSRRAIIPPRPLSKMSLWSFLRNCIGKDLTKIPIPVYFNEPLSMLQRMVEDFIYSDILAKAASCDTTLEELTYVAAFATSCYAANRVNKPFNPMLGETYECDRRAELGWRCIMEQVSHHPPMFAMHVEHKDWTFWQEYTFTSKFRGKYAVCYPIGSCHLVFHRTKSHYTWCKVVITVHNIIVGSIWMDQSGDMKIINHTKKEECHLKFIPYSYFTKGQQRKVKGTVNDSHSVPHYMMRGYWDEKMTCAKVLEGKGKNIVTETPNVLWRANPPQPGSEAMYGFTDFVCSLNEMEEGVAPTDSRLRPDQRIMEKGDFDKANEEKLRLEEQQRARRRKREAAAAKAAEAVANGNHEEAARFEKEATYSPRWFKKEFDPLTQTMMHVYKGGYWEAKLRGDWGGLPNIF